MSIKEIKRICLIAVIVLNLSASVSYAQWSGSPTTAGVISRNGGMELSGMPASSTRTLYSSPRFVLRSSGYAPDGVTRWQAWSLESVQRSIWGAGDIVFSSNRDGMGYVERFRVTSEGNVGIGSTSPTSKLTVNGDIHAEEVRVDLNVPGPDYVFEEDYDLPTLESLQNYIRENKHLPEVPSAEEMEAHGIDLGVMNMLLLKKVEELTLHLIEQNKKMAEQNNVILKLQSRIENLENE